MASLFDLGYDTIYEDPNSMMSIPMSSPPSNSVFKGNVGGMNIYTAPQGEVLGDSTQTKGGQSSQGTSNGGNNNSPTPEEIARQQSEEERARVEREKAERRAAISSEFDPIFSELDRQLSALPKRRAEMEGYVGKLSEGQVQLAKNEEARNIKGLEESKTEETSRGKASLRDLEGDIRNQMEAYQRYFGSMGAGDSSAPLVASEAITKAGLKTRGNILTERNKALATLDSKISDVRSVTQDQLIKIDQWKNSELVDIANDFSSAMDNLQSAKANASAEKQRAINQEIFGLADNFNARLRQLDDMVVNYKMSVSEWNMQRTADLQDYATKLGLQAQYSSAFQPQNALNMFSQSVSLSDKSGKNGVNGDYTGLSMLLPEEEEKEETNA